MGIEYISQAMATGATNASKVANLSAAGGQNGIGPIYSTLSASSPLVLPRAIMVVLETPRMYDNNLAFAYLIKTLFETCARSWSGIDLSYTMDEHGTDIGNDGQRIDMPTKSKRQPVSPQALWHEYNGNVVWNTMYKWLTDTQDPDSNAIGLKTIIDRDEVYDTRLFGATVMVMQPDMTFQARKLINSWIITNMWPKQTGELGAKIEPTGTHSPERNINFSGYLIHNANTIEMGKLLWQTMRLESVNYQKLATGMGTVNSNIKNSALLRDINDVIAATTAA